MAKRKSSAVQGEGDYEAARRYREKVEKFVATHPDAASGSGTRAASDATAGEDSRAERAGRARSRGDDKHDVMKKQVGVAAQAGTKPRKARK